MQSGNSQDVRRSRGVEVNVVGMVDLKTAKIEIVPIILSMQCVS